MQLQTSFQVTLSNHEFLGQTKHRIDLNTSITAALQQVQERVNVINNSMRKIAACQAKFI